MGCCASINKASALPNHRHFSNGKENESRAPPPEEESVKEVLSETPTPKIPIAIANLQEKDPKPQSKPTEPVFKVGDTNLFNYYAAVEEISEVSEICSQSDTVSTTNMTDRKDEEYYEQQVRQRSPPTLRQTTSFSGDLGKKMAMGKSPSLTGRSDQSPGRRNGGSARLVKSREAAAGHQAMVRRVGLKSDPNRRDPGERSGRRSSSPATTRNEGGSTRSGMGRSPSARRTNQSPARVPAGPPERKMEESLEKPLVSLECFIFL